SFSVQPTVTTALPRVSDIVLIDINGDTALDIVASSFTDNKVVYYPNTLANPGTFGSEITIASAIDGAGDVDIVLLDGDSNLDVVVSAFDADKIVWFAGNGDGTFGAENLMINSVVKPGSFDLKDIDNDNDLDLVVANAVNQMDLPGMNTSVIEVFFNSSLTFTKDTNSVTDDKDYLFNVFFENIDDSNNNGITMDILATDIFGNLVHYNRNASNTYDETIISSSIANPSSVAFMNIDNSMDGLKDIILSSATNGPGNDLVWFKNNGAGSFSAETIIDATQNNTFKFTMADFDNDGDLDIASAAYSDDQISIFNNQTIVLSNDEFENERFRLYPNPVSDYLRFDISNLSEVDYAIFTILGEKLLDGNLNHNERVDVSRFNSGIYFFKLIESGRIFRFIKN
ncbi:MAG: T9SS type A sorting domain-containing protein, partial [Flavobacteriaceae bacterium]|nr:T9SS type A sorting domain-containing protein [Bacteroidia bacterium]NNL61822.1 T9SS type A sorting domain-containing protein [Flavobacteriaceae bacterium]